MIIKIDPDGNFYYKVLAKELGLSWDAPAEGDKEVVFSGGMAVVFRIKKEDKYCAVKMLGRERLSDGKIVSWFAQELKCHYRFSQKYTNPHLIQCYEISLEGSPEKWYGVFEWLENGTLEDQIEKISFDDAIHILLGALKGLMLLHDENFIHRDVKPKNIFIFKEGGRLSGKLGDLGLISSLSPNTDFPSHTQLERKVGTPGFMEPNVNSFDKLSDIYSVGASLYWIWKKQIPNENFLENLTEEDRKHPILPIIEKSLAPRNKRYKSIKEIFYDLASLDIPKKKNVKKSFIWFLIFIFLSFFIFLYLNLRETTSQLKYLENKNIKRQIDDDSQVLIEKQLLEERENNLKEALQNLNEKNYEKSLYFLSSLYENYPDWEPAVYWYCKVLADPQVNKIEQAIKIGNKYLEKHPGSVKIKNLVEILIKTKKGG